MIYKWKHQFPYTIFIEAKPARGIGIHIRKLQYSLEKQTPPAIPLSLKGWRRHPRKHQVVLWMLRGHGDIACAERL